MSKITLTNDFHGTEVTLRPRDGRLNKRQVRQAKRALCGRAGCTCSNDAGQRGPQETHLDFRSDGTALVC